MKENKVGEVYYFILHWYMHKMTMQYIMLLRTMISN